MLRKERKERGDTDGAGCWSEADARAYVSMMRRLIRWEYRPWAREVTRDLGKTNGSLRIADLGCGPGFFGFEVASLVPVASLVLIDRMELMLEMAAAEAARYGVTVETVPSPAEQVALADGCLDLVLCKQLLHEAADWKQCLAEMFRLLRPGGMAVLVDFDGEGSRLAALAIRTLIRIRMGKKEARAFWHSFRHGLPRSIVHAHALSLGFRSVRTFGRGPNYYISLARPDSA